MTLERSITEGYTNKKRWRYRILPLINWFYATFIASALALTALALILLYLLFYNEEDVELEEETET